MNTPSEFSFLFKQWRHTSYEIATKIIFANFFDVLKLILKQLPVRARRGRLVSSMDSTVANYSYALFWCYPQSCRHGSVYTNNSIFVVEYGYRVWHSIKGMFQILCGLNSCFFRLLALGTFYLLPFTILLIKEN